MNLPVPLILGGISPACICYSDIEMWFISISGPGRVSLGSRLLCSIVRYRYRYIFLTQESIIV